MSNRSSFTIAGRPIGPNHPPFVIAEMSGNHNQSIDRALQIVEAAARAGAHALKIQTYTPDTMTLDLSEREFFISDPKSPWAGTSLYKLYGQAYTPWDWHQAIFTRARELGLIAFSTPFDATSVAFLEDLNVPCYKIASFENTDLPLIRLVAATGKPLIISTGMASLEELEETVVAAREAGCRQLVLLKCTSTYPASAEHTNILTIPDLRRRFNCEVGLSDHTGGIGVAVASVALGASVIEKHFTLDRAEGGVDSTFSMEPAEMSQLVQETDRAWRALGKVSYGATETEKKSIQFRRSLYVVKDLKAGDLLTKENLRCIRPGYGLAPKFYDQLLGQPVACDVKRGTAMQMKFISPAVLATSP
ncbi:MAG TPA: pseudaminic acid synthase [Opitutaceae bacterium]|nr:pseudaminic acid synthase [Opitutaceae bacterium]